MRAWLSVLALEVRLERRYGMYRVGAGVAALWTLLLLLAPPAVARAIVPLVVFADSATVGGFLLAAMVLFERDERALSAFLVTPMPVHGYVWAKVTTLTVLAVVVAAPVAAAGGRLDLRPAPVLLGVALTAALLLICCFALVARHRTLTSFLSIAPWPLIPLMGIPLARLVGLLESPAAYLVPTVAAAELIAAGFDPQHGVPALWIGYAAAWAGAGGWLAARRFDAAVRELGG